VNRIRVTTTLLICACALVLAACGAPEDTGTPPAAAPTATVALTPAPASPGPADNAGGGSAGDKALCESADEAGKEMKAALIEGMTSGASPEAAAKKAFAGMEKDLTALLADAGDSDVAVALKKMAALLPKLETGDNPAFEKVTAELGAACQAAGVKIDV
jgi:hypothetical protein